MTSYFKQKGTFIFLSADNIHQSFFTDTGKIGFTRIRKLSADEILIRQALQKLAFDSYS